MRVLVCTLAAGRQRNRRVELVIGEESIGNLGVIRNLSSSLSR
jgi:hypothetical protein